VRNCALTVIASLPITTQDMRAINAFDSFDQVAWAQFAEALDKLERVLVDRSLEGLQP
jgi:hypothetical protein